MNCNAVSLGITFLILMTVSKNPALLQKILEDWLRLPESQEIFAGLVTGRNFLALQVINCHRKKFLVTKKKLLVTETNFLPQFKVSCHWKKYPNFRYFGHLLLRLTPAVSDEIFG